MKTIMEDERAILSIFFEDSGEYKTGRNGVEKIEAYREGGEMGNVTWFAVIVDGAVKYRVPSRFVMVQYYPEEPTP